MQLILTRDTDDGVCTLGTLWFAGQTWQTIERPWIPSLSGEPGGMPGRSCVPLGVYTLWTHDSESHPQTWALVNEGLGVTHYGPSNRTAVLIHPANTALELRGCIAPGRVRGTQAVYESRAAFADIKAVLPWIDGHTLTIQAISDGHA